jgi:flagellar protein FlaG
MNIKSINTESIDTIGKYARKVETAEQGSVAQTQSLPKDQSQNTPRDLSRKDISEIVDRLNKGVQEIHERMSFSYHEKTQRIIVKVLNSETNEVVREIPAKEAIKLLEHIQDFLGMLVDESR